MKTKPRTEFLTDWEVALLNQLVESAKNAPAYYNPESVAALAEKLDRASHVRLSYYQREEA